MTYLDDDFILGGRPSEQPPDDPWPDEDPHATSERNSWEPIDLGPYLRGEVPEIVPTLGLARSDGIRLLYPGLEHAVIGEMESGKSWLMCGFTWAEITNQHHVVYIHFEEDNPADTLGRLLALGAAHSQILGYFHFVGPSRAATPDDMLDLIALKPSVVILDGINEAMSMYGMAIREEDGAAAFRRRVVKPFSRTGSAVVACDHVVKDREARGRYALGSIHKANAINGAQFMLETAEPFGRGMRGRSHLYVTKDRPGHLRRHGSPSKIPGKTLIAELVVDDTPEDYLELNLFAITGKKPEPAPEPANERVVDEQLCHDIVDVLTEHGGRLGSQRAVAAALRDVEKGRRDIEVRKALDNLVLDGLVETEQDGRSTAYRLAESASHDQL